MLNKSTSKEWKEKLKDVSTYPLKTRLFVTGELLQIDEVAVLSAHSTAASENKRRWSKYKFKRINIQMTTTTYYMEPTLIKNVLFFHNEYITSNLLPNINSDSSIIA